MSPELFDSRAKAPPAKRWEKGYGNENGTGVEVRLDVNDELPILFFILLLYLIVKCS